MKTITFLNSKGGVGKTTLCLNVAHGIIKAQPLAKLLLIDADLQGSLRKWHDKGLSDMQLLVADTRQSLATAKRMACEADIDYLLIDTPGTLIGLAGSSISISDLVVIPLRPSGLDIWETIDAIDLVKAAMHANPKLQAIFVINQAIVNSSLTLDVCCALAEADATEIDLVKSVVNGRAVYSRSAKQGNSVFAHKDKHAINEIELLTQQILSRLL